MDDPTGATRTFGKSALAVVLATHAADFALRTVRDHLLGETGIERVTFLLRPSGVDAFPRRLATV